MSSDKETDAPRYPGTYEGTVVDNVDPQGLGRVRLRVPGILEPKSDWAWPRGGGKAQRGTYDVPDVDTDVYVTFIAGDPHGKVLYERANHGSPKGNDEVPTPVKAVPAAERPKLKAWESARYVIWVDERNGHEVLRWEDKMLPEDTFFEFDGAKGAVTLNATTGLSLKATGSLFIDGADIQIGGRKLIKNGKPIT